MSSSKSSSGLLVAGTAALVSAATLFFLWNNKRNKKERTIEITLPNWLQDYAKTLQDQTFDSDESMMKVALNIASRNVSEETGGPFGCAIFERSTGGSITTKLFSVGANRVTALNNSTVHGEMVAIQFAQQKLHHYTLRNKTDSHYYILCTSCEPCAMCLGGTLWSGVHEMICSATKADAESIGFNEGPVFDPESYKQLEDAGVKVKKNLLRDEGAKILQEYAKTGVIYNG